MDSWKQWGLKFLALRVWVPGGEAKQGWLEAAAAHLGLDLGSLVGALAGLVLTAGGRPGRSQRANLPTAPIRSVLST